MFLFKFGVMLGKEHLFIGLVFKICKKNQVNSYTSYSIQNYKKLEKIKLYSFHTIQCFLKSFQIVISLCIVKREHRCWLDFTNISVLTFCTNSFIHQHQLHNKSWMANGTFGQGHNSFHIKEAKECWLLYVVEDCTFQMFDFWQIFSV